MEEKLVQVLLDQYKERGINLYALLDDPLFKGIDFHRKVELIKQFASHISSGSSRVLSKGDIRSLILDAGFSGVITGVSAGLAAREAGKYFTKGIVPMGAIAGAAALGAGLAAGASYLHAHKAIKQRDEILQQVDRTAKNPTDENAIRVLTTRGNQLNPHATTLVQSSTVKSLGNVTNKIPRMILDQVDPVINHMSYKHNWNNQTNPYAEGVNMGDFESAYNESGEKMKNSFEDSINNMRSTILGKNN